MMVVVMIFLMALVIIMVRNIELSQDLRTSIDANQAISSANVGLSSQLDTLIGDLGDTEAERKRLNERLLSEISKTRSLSELVLGLEKDVAGLTELKASLSAENLTLLGEKDRLTRENQLLTEDNRLLTNEKQGLETERTELTELTRSLEQEGAALTILNQALEVDKSALIDQTKRLTEEGAALRIESNTQQQKISALSQQEQLLSSQLAQITEQFSALQLDTESQVTTLERTNLNLSDQIDNLTLKLAQLNIELQKRRAQETGLLSQLAEKQKEFDSLQASEQLVHQQFTDASVEIEALAERIRKREQENQLLQSQASEQGQLFISLQDEYNSLEEKYRGLIRAARSPAGKEVAAVYFLRSATGYEYRLQEPGSTTPESVTKGELDNRLGRLKARLGRDLYTRVVIPEDSNLSHNEAWRFTQEILNNYDYYYQPPE